MLIGLMLILRLSKHVFSHRKWHVQIVAGQVTDFHDFSDREVRWLSPEEFKDVPLAKPNKNLAGLCTSQLRQ